MSPAAETNRLSSNVADKRGVRASTRETPRRPASKALLLA